MEKKTYYSQKKVYKSGRLLKNQHVMSLIGQTVISWRGGEEDGIWAYQGKNGAGRTSRTLRILVLTKSIVSCKRMRPADEDYSQSGSPIIKKVLWVAATHLQAIGLSGVNETLSTLELVLVECLSATSPMMLCVRSSSCEWVKAVKILVNVMK